MDPSKAYRASPDQELSILKLLLRIRELGDEEGCEKLRRNVRKALLDSEDEEKASLRLDDLIRHATRLTRKLDGSYEEERMRKRQRREAETRGASKFVELEAGEGNESEDEDEEAEAEA